MKTLNEKSKMWNDCVNVKQIESDVNLYIMFSDAVIIVAKRLGYSIDRDGVMKWLSTMTSEQRLQLNICEEDYKTMKMVYKLGNVKKR